MLPFRPSVVPACRVPRRRGFTLAETMIVLIMVGVLAAIAAPRLDVQRFHLDSAVHAVTTTVLAAQREAVSRQHNVLVLVDSAAGTMRIGWDANNDEQLGTGERARAVALPPAVRFGRLAVTGAPGGPTGAITPLRSCGGTPCLVLQRNGSADRVAGFYLSSARAITAGGTPSRDLARETRYIEVQRASGRPHTWTFTGTTWRRAN